ncbi:MAG: hypothetical protein OEV30_08385, partial [Ignavibacteria bacterium]|nr:hypothetical protein [Ignavibacteria bacterium]
GDDYTDATITDGSGAYLFTDVPTGSPCRIWVDLTTVPDGKVPGSCRTRVACSPKPGKSYLDVDFCFRESNEGCTPGYWKNHEDSWGPTGLITSQTMPSVFSEAGSYPELVSASLIDALAFGGGPGVEGAARNLARAAVAALLNASHPDVAYTMSSADLIAAVNGAFASGHRDTMLALMESLDNDNNLGCPLN